MLKNRQDRSVSGLLAVAFLLLLSASLQGQPLAGGTLQVGAAVVDVTPDQLPVLVNGSMTSRSVDRIKTRVNARTIVIDDGNVRLALVVVDSCMMPREFLDEVKQLAASRTGIAAEHMMISATHTHTAPSSMGALGTDPDPTYVPLLRQRIVESIEAAEQRLTPARVGWASAQAPQFTALRRWVLRPDRIGLDPFGNPTVRANMHAARDPDNAIGPSGPEDPELSLIAFQTLDGKPLAVLANFSMHYFGDQDISADYFGLFCDGLTRQLSIASEKSTIKSAEPVVMMSHGCSGDIWRRDYMQRQSIAEGPLEQYAAGLVDVAKPAYQSIDFSDDVSLAMQETRLGLAYRVPDAQRLQWARQIVAEMGDRLPKTQPEIYAREQVYLNELQATDVVVQAIRIGDIAIATTPTETYALTGLKLKHASPLEHIMVIELANGGDGYIPPPEQHRLGGYNTWAARSAGLEIEAEPKIVAAATRLLEIVCDAPRQSFRQSLGELARHTLDARPAAYWRLDEMSGGLARDTSGNGRHAVLEPGVLYFLDGPDDSQFCDVEGLNSPSNTRPEVNRCVHLAGGRMRAALDHLTDEFTIVLSVWNGMPAEARQISGWAFSRDLDRTLSASGIHFGISGSDGEGLPILQIGNAAPVLGTVHLPRWQWRRYAIVVGEDEVRVFSDASQEAEMSAPRTDANAAGGRGAVSSEQLALPEWFFGGRSDGDSGWEGKLDEVAVFSGAFSEAEVRKLLGSANSEN